MVYVARIVENLNKAFIHFYDFRKFNQPEIAGIQLKGIEHISDFYFSSNDINIKHVNLRYK